MDDLNSFQRWAIDYGRAFGFTVTPCANWVKMQRGEEMPVEVMSAQGVQDLCQAQGVKA